MTALLDRGLLYGDGFFTTLLVQSGCLANWPAHWHRLQHSAERLKFPPLSEADVLAQVDRVLHESAPLADYEIIKILVTRGVGGKGYQPPLEVQPALYIQRFRFPEFRAQNVQAWPFFTVKMTLSEVACAQQPLLAGLKHCNRLENVLARQALMGTEFDEALMLGQKGEVISATQANVVLIKGNTLMTPSLNDSGVEGTCVTSLPMALAQSRTQTAWQWQTAQLALEDVLQADEVFCCNAIRGVMPVTQFKNRDYQTQKGTQIAQAWLKWQSQNLFQL